MVLTSAQRAQFAERGILILPSVVDQTELAELGVDLERELAEDSPRRIVEKDGTTVRSVYASHRHTPAFRRLATHPMLVGAAEELLGHDVYVYQFKINIKAAFGGDVWDWHQDFVYWNREDGLPHPDIVTLSVCLDDVTEFNGPLFVVPGSHSLGLMSPAVRAEVAPGVVDRRAPYKDQPAWVANLIAKLKYTIDGPTLKELVDRFGLESLRGPRGSVLAFHSNIVHSSPPNISPFRRAIALITYCRTDNVPAPTATPRPDFLVATDHKSVRARVK